MGRCPSQASGAQRAGSTQAGRISFSVEDTTCLWQVRAFMGMGEALDIHPTESGSPQALPNGYPSHPSPAVVSCDAGEEPGGFLPSRACFRFTGSVDHTSLRSASQVAREPARVFVRKKNVADSLTQSADLLQYLEGQTTSAVLCHGICLGASAAQRSAARWPSRDRLVAVEGGACASLSGGHSARPERSPPRRLLRTPFALGIALGRGQLIQGASPWTPLDCPRPAGSSARVSLVSGTWQCRLLWGDSSPSPATGTPAASAAGGEAGRSAKANGETLSARGMGGRNLGRPPFGRRYLERTTREADSSRGGGGDAIARAPSSVGSAVT